MTGWCPYKEGTLEEQECHFDGYCYECPDNKCANECQEYVCDGRKYLPYKLSRESLEKRSNL